MIIFIMFANVFAPFASVRPKSGAQITAINVNSLMVIIFISPSTKSGQCGLFRWKVFQGLMPFSKLLWYSPISVASCCFKDLLRSLYERLVSLGAFKFVIKLLESLLLENLKHVIYKRRN